MSFVGFERFLCGVFYVGCDMVLDSMGRRCTWFDIIGWMRFVDPLRLMINHHDSDLMVAPKVFKPN